MAPGRDYRFDMGILKPPDAVRAAAGLSRAQEDPVLGETAARLLRLG